MGFWRKYYLTLGLPILTAIFTLSFFASEQGRMKAYAALVVFGFMFLHGFFVIAPFLDGEK